MTQFVLIVSFILGSAMTVISALTITLGSLQDQWKIVLGFNVGMLGGSITIAFANSLEKIYSWDDKQKEYGKHTQKLYSLWDGDYQPIFIGTIALILLIVASVFLLSSNSEQTSKDKPVLEKKKQK